MSQEKVLFFAGLTACAPLCSVLQTKKTGAVGVPCDR